MILYKHGSVFLMKIFCVSEKKRETSSRSQNETLGKIRRHQKEAIKTQRQHTEQSIIVRLQKDADETEPSINSSDDDFAPGPKIRLARPFALQQDGSNESEMESRFAEDSDAEGAQRSTRSISGKSLPYSCPHKWK